MMNVVVGVVVVVRNLIASTGEVCHMKISLFPSNTMLVFHVLSTSFCDISVEAQAICLK